MLILRSFSCNASELTENELEEPEAIVEMGELLAVIGAEPMRTLGRKPA